MSLIAAKYLPIQEGFKGKGKEIASIVSSSSENVLQPLNHMVMALKNNCIDTLVELFKNLDQKLFAKWVKESNPESFEDIDWLCNSILQIDAKWLDSAMKNFSDEDFFALIKKVRKGDIDSLLKVIQFQRTYVTNIKRSHFKEYIKRYSQLLEDCGLEELQYSASYSDPLHELPVFDKDIKEIFASLNRKQLSKDFASVSPRHWGKLLMISNLSHHTNFKIISKIIDGINVQALVKNVEKYYKYYTYELRLLIYQLCYGSEEKRKQFALGIKPFIKTILTATKENDVNDIFKAFCRLDFPEGEKLGQEIGKPVPELMKVDYSGIKKIKAKTKKLEALGEDYDLSNTKFSIKTKNDQENKSKNI
jgi:hypothetical protein